MLDPHQLDGTPQEGELIAGKYRVQRVLGKGGMGVVVAAEHLALRQLVAVKFLLPEALKMPEAVERFHREARAAAAIRSEHVARVIDVGMLETGAPYLVMEFLTGTDLRAALQARGPLPAEEVVDHLMQACEALAEAHKIGILHRDLKPANLFLADSPSGTPSIKVLDFGLSKAIGPNAEHEESLTTADAVMGSFVYMAPEQIRGIKNADVRSDIWSLGICLYQLIVGKRPFEGSSLSEVILKIAQDPPPTLASRGIDAPEGLWAVIQSCLEKDQQCRPQTIAELATRLEPFGTRSSALSLERILAVTTPDDKRQSKSISRIPVPSSRRPGQSSQSGQSAQPVQIDAAGEQSVLAASRSATGQSSPSVGTVVLPRSRWASRARWSAAGIGVTILCMLVVTKLGLGLHKPSSAIDSERLTSFAPLSANLPGPENPLSLSRVQLGRALFYETKLSSHANISCDSCHSLDHFGVDGKRLSRGTDNREPARNTLSVYNISGAFAYLWDGRKNTLAEQAEEVLLSSKEMGMSKEQVEAGLQSSPAYLRAFQAAFPGEQQPITFSNVALALASFEESLVTRGRWDRFLEGDRKALTDEEKAGFNRFVEVGCVSCHFGAAVGATMFQKLGLVKAWPDNRDRGRFELTRRESDWMVFRVPSLRNVAETGPYFHDGSVASLEEAIRMMGRHQIGRELSDEDVTLILSFLKALTGEIPRDAISPRGLEP